MFIFGENPTNVFLTQKQTGHDVTFRKEMKLQIFTLLKMKQQIRSFASGRGTVSEIQFSIFSHMLYVMMLELLLIYQIRKFEILGLKFNFLKIESILLKVNFSKKAKNSTCCI